MSGLVDANSKSPVLEITVVSNALVAALTDMLIVSAGEPPEYGPMPTPRSAMTRR